MTESSIKKIVEDKVKIKCDHDLDEKTEEHIINGLKRFLEVYAEKYGLDSIQDFSINIHEMNIDGKSREYEMKANLLTNHGSYHATKVDWKPGKAFNHLIQAIKKQVLE